MPGDRFRNRARQDGGVRFCRAPHEPWRNSTAACACTEHRGSLDTIGAPALPHNSAGARAFIERRASQRAAARWRALLQSAVAARAQQARLAFYRAPWQPGHSRRAGASAERLRLAQQQPEHNSPGLTSASAFGPFLGQSGRAAWLARPFELHEHSGAWLQARPGFVKPRAPPAMARAWPFQKVSGYKGAVLVRGRP